MTNEITISVYDIIVTQNITFVTIFVFILFFSFIIILYLIENNKNIIDIVKYREEN